MRLVLISDTHARHNDLVVPDGDVLVHAGDFTNTGEPADVIAFSQWLAGLAHPHKIVIAGNHDLIFEQHPAWARTLLPDVTYLQDSGVTVDGVQFYGSPWQPAFFDWAFNLPRGRQLREKWLRIPRSTDVLITHGPPRGILDRNTAGEPSGCDDLAEIVALLAPRVHVFGHIHEGYGTQQRGDTTYVNASALGDDNCPTNLPIVIDL